MSLIEITPPKTSSARVYRGGPSSVTSAPVSEMWHRRAQPGDQFCTSAHKTGEVCGWTVEGVGKTIQALSGVWVRNIVTSKAKRGQCLIGGDSGGAVYTVKSNGSVAAKGIINAGTGGGLDAQGGFTDPCRSSFTDIWDAYYGFPGTLRTS
jgi:hypothetical protein